MSNADAIIQKAAEGMNRPTVEQDGYVAQAVDANVSWKPHFDDPKDPNYKIKIVPDLSVAHLMNAGNSYAAFSQDIPATDDTFSELQFEFTYSEDAGSDRYYKAGTILFSKISGTLTLRDTDAPFSLIDDFAGLFTASVTAVGDAYRVAVTSSSPTGVSGSIRIWIQEIPIP